MSEICAGVVTFQLEISRLKQNLKCVVAQVDNYFRVTPKNREALLRNMGFVKKTPKNRGAFVQHRGIEKNQFYGK